MDKKDYYNSLFEYKNGELFWKVKSALRIKIGDKAGSLNNKYYTIRLNKKLLFLHRIVWEMHNGDIPEKLQIDHINQIPTDNRIENLRLVTCNENNKNKSKQSNNKTGFTGILYVEKCKTNPWKVSIGRYYKFFPTLELAISHRDEKYIELGYHENHGQ